MRETEEVNPGLGEMQRGNKIPTKIGWNPRQRSIKKGWMLRWKPCNK
jgi:hypothetical protein